jgi:hypothetical protein
VFLHKQGQRILEDTSDRAATEGHGDVLSVQLKTVDREGLSAISDENINRQQTDASRMGEQSNLEEEGEAMIIGQSKGDVLYSDTADHAPWPNHVKAQVECVRVPDTFNHNVGTSAIRGSLDLANWIVVKVDRNCS